MSAHFFFSWIPWKLITRYLLYIKEVYLFSEGKRSNHSFLFTTFSLVLLLFSDKTENWTKSSRPSQITRSLNHSSFILFSYFCILRQYFFLTRYWISLNFSWLMTFRDFLPYLRLTPLDFHPGVICWQNSHCILVYLFACPMHCLWILEHRIRRAIKS